MTETKPVGRKRQPLEDRLAKVVGHDVSFDSWPQPGLDCWPGPRLIWDDGQMRSTRRACLTRIFQTSIHPGHKITSSIECTRGWERLRQAILKGSPEAERLGLKGSPEEQLRALDRLVCVNPHHAILTRVAGLSTGEAIPDLPQASASAFEAEAMDFGSNTDDDIREASEWIEGDPEVRKARTAEQLYEDCFRTWDIETLREALSILQVLPR